MDFKNFSTSASSPSVDQIEVIPDDDADLPEPVRSIYIGNGGTLRITNPKGNVVNFTGLLGGFPYPYAAIRIHSTGTTATGIVGLI